MRKFFPYILGGIVCVLLFVLITSNRSKPVRRLDERITLKQQDKIPYGTKVARELLSSLFPDAALPYDAKYPGNWDSIDTDAPNQAVILIADYLDADEEELERLSEFVAEGNYVFIIARSASDDVPSFFKFAYNSDYYAASGDSLRIKLGAPSYASDLVYTYPGKKYESFFYLLDTLHTSVLGRNAKELPNFIQLNSGKGSFFIHSAPLAFSNYFILHKRNIEYYQKVFSVLPKNISTILWNEYYLQKPYSPNKNDEPNWLSALFSYPSFKWGLLIGTATLALFVLLGMRRRQRMIPLHSKPKNDSLDFVKTLGRLYYDKRDHKNLAIKMTAYFLEHVRSKYKLPTHTLDDDFIQLLHFKSGYAEEEIKKIVTFMGIIKSRPSVSDNELFDFHKQLELFYQNT